MKFDNYALYSTVLNSDISQEYGNTEDIVNKILLMEKYNDLNDAKQFLKSEFDVDDYIYFKNISSDCSLEITDSLDMVVYNFKLPNQHVIYSYTK